jgi:hypothetical protein
MGGPWYSEDARNVRLTDFQFRVNERFLYEYDLGDLLGQTAECVRERDRTALRDRIEEIPELEEWLLLHKFDRRKVNRHLRQYATGDEEWQWQ